MELKAYAKINWDLHILGKRADGFHELDMVMANVSLYDTLSFEPHSSLEFTCSDPSLPTDERNLVVKAAHLLSQATGTSSGAKIHLTKLVPAGGGMGGGSSDGACALLGLSRLWNLNWPIEKLHPIAAQLGSDVAFFLYGGWRRCTGRGEIVEAIPGSDRWPKVPLLLILPPLQVSTPAAYKMLKAPDWDGKTALRTLTAVTNDLNLMLQRLWDNDQSGLGLTNGLTQAAQSVEPRLTPMQAVLQQMYPGRWLMSGSGAVHFVVSHPDDDGSRLRKQLENEAGPGIRVLTATTVTP